MGERNMDQIIKEILNSGSLIWIVGLILGALGIVFGALSAITKTLARERTKREIAAYIAEGSMTPEQGEKLLKARQPND